MKKKTIFVVLCVVLLLLFTSLSYGWWGNLRPQPIQLQEDPPAKHQKARILGDLPLNDPGKPDLGDPWDHALSPRGPDDATVQVNVSVFLIRFNFNAPMVLCISKRAVFR